MLPGLVVLSTLLLLTLYWFPARRRMRRWGATDADLVRVMSGDAEVADPTYQMTTAITIEAPASAIWPWLLQMGYRRGGLYSYDWLDRIFGYLDCPSAERVLPEFQGLNAGDEIPVGRGPGFPVRVVDPCRALVLAGSSDGFTWSWQFGLYPLDERRTRLVSRNRVRPPRTIIARLGMCVLEPAAFIMLRKMLLGLKRRAEHLAAAPSDLTARGVREAPARGRLIPD
jgi:hypothetical protein